MEDHEMKKILLMMLSAVSITAVALPAAAIVLTPEAGVNVSSSYARVVGGKVVYDKSPTAYSSSSFNKIMEAYGLALKPDAVGGVPTSYANVVGGKVVFNEIPIAYEPAGYHSIFTSYGLQLSPENAAAAKLGSVDYADVVDGKIVFVAIPTAYDGEGFALILSAYEMAMAATTSSVSTSGVTSKQDTGIVDSDGDGVADADDACPDTPVGARVDSRGCWVLNIDYLFDFDKSMVKVQYYPFLDELAVVMKNNPAMKVEIQGHTDSVGTNVYNQGLSMRRAKAIRAYLAKQVSDPSLLTAVGFGEEKPAYSNDTSEGQAKNRRVELHPKK
jgi:OOP family OmpA-OmpF porin